MYSEKHRFYSATNKSGFVWGVKEVKLKFSIYNSFHSCICKQVDIVSYLHNSGVLNISSSVHVGDLGASDAMMLLSETNLVET